jgi:predicted FMN-binding regulatory protein PaiB
MTLAELKKLAIRRQVRIRFAVESTEALIDEHGIAKVPGLQNVPTFNLDHALGTVAQFRLELLGPDGKAKSVQNANGQEVAKMIAGLSAAGAAKATDDHDE